MENRVKGDLQGKLKQVRESAKSEKIIADFLRCSLNLDCIKSI